jgi:hypothetical protein
MAIAIDQNDGISQFTATGGETNVDFDWPLYEKAHLTILQTETDGTINTLVLDTDYNIADDQLEVEAGGTAVLTSAGEAVEKYTALLDPTVERETDFNQAGDFFAETLNRELDLITQMLQAMKRDLGKSARLPLDSLLTDLYLPTPEAGKALVWNAGEDGLTNTVGTLAELEADIAVLAPIAADISAVADIDSNVTTVAGIQANVTTVAGIAANVTTVAGISANVTSVAGNATNINAVAGNATNINTVAGDTTEINVLAPISADITTVAGIDTETTTVAGIAANVTTVAGISANVTTVAGIAADVTAVAGDATDIGTVATNIASVNTVAGIAADVTAVAAIDSDVTTVAANIVDIQNAEENANEAAASAASAAAYATNYAYAATMDSEGIQDAIDSLAEGVGGKVILRAGEYTVNDTIMLRSGVMLEGQGIRSTILKAKANLNKTMIQSKDFASLTGTTNSSEASGVPSDFGLSGLQINGNKANQSSTCKGVEFFGRRISIPSAVVVHSCNGDGWHFELGRSDGSISTFNNLVECFITSIGSFNNVGKGIYWSGPHNAKIDYIVAGNNGDWGFYAEDTANTNAGVDNIGCIHTYANYDGKGQYYAGTSFRIATLLLDGDSLETTAAGTDIRVNELTAIYAARFRDVLKIAGNRFTVGKASITVHSTYTSRFKIVNMTSSYNAFGHLIILGNTKVHDGIYISGDYNSINSGYVDKLKGGGGTPCDALYITGGDYNTITLVIIDCDNGLNYISGTRNVINLRQFIHF